MLGYVAIVHIYLLKYLCNILIQGKDKIVPGKTLEANTAQSPTPRSVRFYGIDKH